MSFTAKSLTAALTLAASATPAFGNFWKDPNPQDLLEAKGIYIKNAEPIPREFQRLREGRYDVTGNVKKPCQIQVFRAPIDYPSSTRRVVITDCKFK